MINVKNYGLNKVHFEKVRCFLFNFFIIVGFKAKARASAYLNNLGWRHGCVFVCGVCGCVCEGVDIYVFMVGVVWEF